MCHSPLVYVNHPLAQPWFPVLRDAFLFSARHTSAAISFLMRRCFGLPEYPTIGPAPHRLLELCH